MTVKIKTLVVDDEPIARARMVSLLRDEADIEVVGECENGLEAKSAIESTSPDLLFLDVQMPELDGFMVLEALADVVGADRLPAVVFVTAYDDYALRAFDVSAVDFLLKPFDAERFERALARGRATSRALEGGAGVRALLAHLRNAATAPTGGYAKRLAVRAEGKVYLVRIED